MASTFEGDAPPEAENAAREAVDAAILIHRELGPGLLEKTYRVVLAEELRARGLRVVEEVALPVTWRGRIVEQALRIDLLVDDSLVIEIKACEAIRREHIAQVLTYLRMSGAPLGLLFNFNLFPLGTRRVILS